MVEKRKRPVSAVGTKKLKLDATQEIPEVDNTRKEINKVYSKLISKDARDRVKLTQKVLGLLGEDLLASSKKHDLCRVIQACLKYGNDQQKANIYESLKPAYSEIASGKYSYFLAKKLLKVGEKELLLAEVLQNARQMFCQTHGIRFLELLYNEGNYRHRLMQALFGSENEEISRESIVELKTVVPVKKIMKKGLIDFQLVMHVVYLYVTVSDQPEKLEILNGLHEKFENLLVSRYGAMLAIQSLACSDSKQRKSILKSSQALVKYIQEPESYAYLYFIKLIEVIDDTVRVKKTIALPVIQNLKAILFSNTGAKFIMGIVPYEHSFGALSANELETLQDSLNFTSKKSVALKKKEFFIEISQKLMAEIQENFEEVINNPRINFTIIPVVVAIVQADLKSKSFVQECAKCVVNWNVMDHNAGHRILKRIVEVEAEHKQKLIVKNFLRAMTEKTEYLGKLVKSKGVWVFVAIAEKSGLKNKARKLFKPLAAGLDPKHSGEKTLLEILNKPKVE